MNLCTLIKNKDSSTLYMHEQSNTMNYILFFFWRCNVPFNY